MKTLLGLALGYFIGANTSQISNTMTTQNQVVSNDIKALDNEIKQLKSARPTVNVEESIAEKSAVLEQELDIAKTRFNMEVDTHCRSGYRNKLEIEECYNLFHKD